MSKTPDRLIAEQAVNDLLRWIGDANRPGLADTPRRVVEALSEMTAGYRDDPKEILSKVFEENCDEIIICRKIPFTSLCEHHLLPFVGEVDIGYIPLNKKVVGLSKLARLVDCFSRRLQMQERMTSEIAWAIDKNLGPEGVAVVVRASHACLACRGARKPGAEMITSVMLGAFRGNDGARAEFLALCK